MSGEYLRDLSSLGNRSMCHERVRAVIEAADVHITWKHMSGRERLKEPCGAQPADLIPRD